MQSPVVYNRRVKPRQGTKYNPRFWDDLGVGQPSLYLPLLGVRGGGAVANYATQAIGGTLHNSGLTFPSIQQGGIYFPAVSGVGIVLSPTISVGSFTWVCGLNANSSQPNVYANLLTQGSTKGIWISGGKIDLFDSGDHKGNTTITDNANHIVALTYDSTTGTANFYLDGKADGTGSVGLGISFVFDGIGCDSGTSGEAYKGLIYFQTLFPKALSTSQITDLYNNPYGAFTRNTITYFALAGATTYNITGSGEVLVSGSAISKATYLITASGKGVVSGSAPLSLKIIETASGKVVVSGSAVVSHIVSNNGSGLVKLSGSSNSTASYNQTGNGRILISGSSKLSDVYKIVGSGDALISGKIFIGDTLKGSGTILISGIANNKDVHNPTINGIINISGVSPNKADYLINATGKVLINGNALRSEIFSIISSGKVLISGLSINYISLVNIGSGTTLVSGTSLIKQISNIQSLGSVEISGISKTKSIYNTSSGGEILISGISKNNSIFLDTGSGSVIVSSFSQTNRTANIIPIGKILTSGISKINILCNTISQGELLLNGLSTNKFIFHLSSSGKCTISGYSTLLAKYNEIPNGKIIALGGALYSFPRTYYEFGNGIISLSGEILNYISKQYTINYKEGNIAFIKSSALKGELEPVAIRRVLVSLIGNTIITKYITSYNEIFIEGELIDEGIAIGLATTYRQNQINKIKDYMSTF